MIKSLLDADENPPPDTKVIIEETIIEQPRPPVANVVGDENLFTRDQIKEVEDILEIPSTASGDSATILGGTQTNAEITTATEYANIQSTAEVFSSPSDASNQATQTNPPTDAPLFQSAFEPDTQAETMRKSGLAYAAAITLFGAVAFMMVLGWGADLLLGTSWGVVAGIVIGALIGFVQFFRLSSQIFK